MKKIFFQTLLIAAMLCPNIAVASSCSVPCTNGQCPIQATIKGCMGLSDLAMTNPCTYWCGAPNGNASTISCPCEKSRKQLAPERQREVLQEIDN